MEPKEWTKWCRLCGRNNGSDVDATLKLKSTETLSEYIRKYFGILISESDICTKICNECNNTINSIVKYNSQVLKVNGMFLELQKSYLNKNLNLSSLRKKYGLNNNTNRLSDSDTHDTDFGLVKVDIKSVILNNNLTPVEIKPCKVIVKNISFKTKLEDNSTTKQTEIDESSKHINENSSVVFPFGLNDLDDVNLRCRYCNKKFHKKDSLIKHTENHFNYILTCNICKKHFYTKQRTQYHKITHLNYVKSKTLSNSPTPVDVKSCKVIEYNNISFKSKPEDNSTTKQTEIGEVITHSTDVKSKTLNNSPPPPCLLEMEIGDVTDVDLENLLSSSESNDELPLAHVKSKTLNNSPPPVDVNSCKVIEYSDISLKTKPEDNSTKKQTEIEEAIKPPNENFSVVFPFGLNDLDEVNLRCRYCNKKFHKKDSLIKHTENHFNYILTCNICKKHFSTKQSLQYHKKTHLTDVRSLSDSLAPPCLIETEIGDVTDLNLENSVSSFESNDVCPNEWVNEDEMQQQTNIKQGGDDNINLNQQAETPSEKERFFDCNICQKRFTFRGKTNHMRKHFANKDIVQNPFPLKCRVCGKSWKDLSKLRSHEAVHLPENQRKSYECSYCKKKYKAEYVLKYHIRFVHENDRSFMCEICGEAFPNNINLRGHMLIHSKERKFKCSKCEKTFKRARDLKVHLDVHEGTVYPCQICGLKLNTRRILRTHMIVHSNENRHKCNICSRQFKRLEQFKLHLMSHWNIKPFECFICNVSFGSQSSCRIHQKNVHPVELAAADLTDKPKTAKNVPSMKYLYEFNERALSQSVIYYVIC